MKILLKPFYILRSILSTALIFTITIVLGIPMLLLLAIFGYKVAFKSGLNQLWGKLFCWILGARVRVKGLENVPKDKGVVYLFSHSSYLDIPVIFGYVPGIFNFAASAFVQRYPIVGIAMRLSGTIIIYKDREKSIKEYKKAEERLQQGYQFMVSPEGGRSTGDVIDPFKSGPFIFAMNSKATLVPIVICGAHKVFPKHEYFPSLSSMGGKVFVEVLPEVDISDWTDENRKEKAELIRQDMIESLEGLKKLL